MNTFLHLNPISGGVRHTCPTNQIYLPAESHDRGGSKYTQNLSFVITEHLKLVSGEKIFLRRMGGCQSRLGS